MKQLPEDLDKVSIGKLFSYRVNFVYRRLPDSSESNNKNIEKNDEKFDQMFQ